MTIGSFAWAGIACLVWFLATIALLPLLNKRDWVSDDNYETTMRMGNAYVGEEKEKEKETNPIHKTLGLFFYNIRSVIWVYALACALTYFAPSTKITIAVTWLGALYTLLSNGLMAAFTMVLIQQIEPKGAFKLLLASLLPHGVLELSALFAILGHSVWIANSGEFQPGSSLVYIAVSAFALLIAAGVEVYITPKLTART